MRRVSYNTWVTDSIPESIPTVEAEFWEPVITAFNKRAQGSVGYFGAFTLDRAEKRIYVRLLTNESLNWSNSVLEQLTKKDDNDLKLKHQSRPSPGYKGKGKLSNFR